ncbi:MAG TPA: outer membrane beta-barrel protein [Bryobacteraceae bacterium]|nr:outer membrane beta-barrel protein [Bryobacteraceae bacterium]
MRSLRGYLPLLALLLACAPFAGAQSSFDLNLGFGSAHDASNGTGIDNASSPTNPFGGCTPGTGDIYCQTTPALSGFFLGFGGDVLLQKHYGFGAEVSFNPAKQDYGPLQYRETFYDFNGIYAPVNEKKVQLKIMGGIGGARTGFSFTQSTCIGTAACSSYSTPVANANHFQLHVGVGVEIFVTEHVFIRPQFDFHYVPGFTDEFNSTAVPAGMVWVGYSWGDR